VIFRKIGTLPQTQNKKLPTEGDYMNIKQKMSFVLISVILLSATALAAPTTHDTNAKASLKVPVAAFSAFPTSCNSPLKVVFTDKSTGLPTSWNWNFGDGKSSTARNPVHTYNKAGTYTVTLTVKNVKGNNKITKYSYITVLAPLKAPAAAFTASPISGNAPLKVTLTDTSTGTPTSWNWNFGDGTSSTEKNPTHIYSKAGKFTVALTVKNIKGNNKITKNSYITVLAPLKAPVAAFTVSPTSGYAPLKVVFTDTSTGTPTSWNWNFGDGNTSIEHNPAHLYYTAGNYTINLTVTNTNGTNSTFASITVLKPVLPVANFSTNISEGYAPLSVQFTDHSENATGVSWDFDSNRVVDSTDRNPIHEYAAPGTYTVNLTAVYANGTDSKLATITVSERPAIILPVANFSSNVTKGYSPLTVQFTDLSENATEWNWDFGDGTNLTDKNPVHTYSKDRTYNVTLTVKNAEGNNTITKYGYITVDSSKVVDVVCKMKIYKITAKFTSEYKGTTYYFCMAGCKAKFDSNPEKYITLPVADFSSNVTKGYSPLTVQFTDLSENATEWNWDFGDSANSTDKNPVHTYSKDGTYNVTLTAKNVNGNNTITKFSYITVDSSEVVDVVCKMVIDKRTAEFKSEYKGKTYYFCMSGCKTKFDADPEKYINS
jgi:PKD repeat protein